MLVVVYINNLDEPIFAVVSNFASDTKIGSVVDCEQNCLKLQSPLDQLGKWIKE